VCASVVRASAADCFNIPRRPPLTVRCRSEGTSGSRPHLELCHWQWLFRTLDPPGVLTGVPVCCRHLHRSAVCVFKSLHHLWSPPIASSSKCLARCNKTNVSLRSRTASFSFLNLVRLQVSTPTRTLSLNHTLFSHQPAHTHSRSLSPFLLSLSLLPARSLILSHTRTCTHTQFLSHTGSLIHSNCTLSLSLVYLLSLLLSVLCVYSLHRRRSYVCHVALSANAHAPGTPTPGRIGGFLFTPTYFYLIQFRFWRVCAPSFPSLVLTPFFGFFVSHSQLESGRECLSVSMHT
jgi:hypothetical protein